MVLRTSSRIIGRAWLQWNKDDGAVMGAALAYYTLFSLAPLLVIAISIAGVVFGEDKARQEVVEQLKVLMGDDIATTIETVIVNVAQQPATSFWGPFVGFAVLVVGALSIFLHIRRCLCRIWHLPLPRGSTLLGIVLNYGLAVSMIIIVGVLLLASLLVSTFLPVVATAVQREFPIVATHGHWIEFVSSIFFVAVLFALVYRILSGRKIHWGYVIYGSLISAFLFTIGKTLLALFLAHSHVASIYGGAGSVVLFLIWIYYSSHILFFGAELIQARRTRHEWMKDPASTGNKVDAP